MEGIISNLYASMGLRWLSGQRYSTMVSLAYHHWECEFESYTWRMRSNPNLSSKVCKFSFWALQLSKPIKKKPPRKSAFLLRNTFIFSMQIQLRHVVVSSQKHFVFNREYWRRITEKWSRPSRRRLRLVDKKLIKVGCLY